MTVHAADDLGSSWRRIEPHTGSPLWIVVRPVYSQPPFASPVRAWVWTEATREMEVSFGPVALCDGDWTAPHCDVDEGELPVIFDTKAEAEAFAASLKQD
jgi:hypothetical protein